MLLLGFAGGFRRSELVALTIADIVFSDDGLKVTLRHSKTDRKGRAAAWAFHMAAIRNCARCVRSVAGWTPPASRKGAFPRREPSWPRGEHA